MSRVKRGVTAHARHKKVLKQAKGYRGARSKVFRVAKQAVIKPANTPIATVVRRNGISAPYGSRASRRRP